MPREEQLFLPGIAPHTVRPVDTALLQQIEEYVRVCWERRLCGLRIKYRVIVDILSKPDLYWEKIEKDDGSGRKRTFYVPKGALFEIHKKLARYLQRNFRIGTIGNVSTAYWKKTSIIENADPHRTNRSSMCFDLYGAFESVSTKHVYRFLMRVSGFRPTSSWVSWKERFEWRKTHDRRESWEYNYPERNTKYVPKENPHHADITWSLSKEDAWVLAHLLTYRGKIRLGSPASPVLFNLMLDRLDRDIISTLGIPNDPCSRREYRKVVKRYQGKYVLYQGPLYTRYADDLCFSHPDDVFPYKIANQILGVISRNYFRVNHTKTMRGARGVMEFPGVVVIDGALAPTKAYIERVTGDLPKMQKKTAQGHLHYLSQFSETSEVRKLREKLKQI